jgi:hypothetical protein
MDVIVYHGNGCRAAPGPKSNFAAPSCERPMSRSGQIVQ